MPKDDKSGLSVKSTSLGQATGSASKVVEEVTGTLQEGAELGYGVSLVLFVSRYINFTYPVAIDCCGKSKLKQIQLTLKRILRT